MILCPCIWQRLSGKPCCQWKVLLVTINHNVSSIGDEGLPIYQKGPLHPVCPHRVSTSPQNVSRGRIKKIHEGAESLSSLFNRDALYYSREGGPSIEILQRLASDLHSPRVRDSLKQTSGQKHFLTVIFSPFRFLISYAMWRIASTQGKRSLRKV